MCGYCPFHDVRMRLFICCLFTVFYLFSSVFLIWSHSCLFVVQNFYFNFFVEEVPSFYWTTKTFCVYTWPSLSNYRLESLSLINQSATSYNYIIVDFHWIFVSVLTGRGIRSAKLVWFTSDWLSDGHLDAGCKSFRFSPVSVLCWLKRQRFMVLRFWVEMLWVWEVDVEFDLIELFAVKLVFEAAIFSCLLLKVCGVWVMSKYTLAIASDVQETVVTSNLLSFLLITVAFDLVGAKYNRKVPFLHIMVNAKLKW